MIIDMYVHDSTSLEAAKADDNIASCSGGVLRYRRKAELCHRPNSWIVESSTPANAAVVAAPIRKLCPAYWPWGTPRVTNILRISPTNVFFRRGFPAASMNRGPGRSPRLAKYPSTAATGQRLVSVWPRTTSTPFPY